MYGEKGIRVNSVAPGPIWTPLIPATMPAEKVEYFGSDVPLGRPGQPAELAPVYVLLASDEAATSPGPGSPSPGADPYSDSWLPGPTRCERKQSGVDHCAPRTLNHVACAAAPNL